MHADLDFLQVLINPALQALNFATPSYQDNACLLPGITSAEKEVTNWLRYAGVSLTYLPALLANQHVSLASGNTMRMLEHLDSQRRLPRYMNLTKRRTGRLGEALPSVAGDLSSLVADSRFCPMLTDDLSDVANAYIIVSHYDVLRDEGVMYAHRLLENKVKVKLKHYPGAFHGFFMFSGGGWIKFQESLSAMEDLVSFLNMHVFGLRSP